VSRKAAPTRKSSDSNAEDDEEVVPLPSALIESLRSFGYTPATAIADLVDNSVTAGATQVEIVFRWEGVDSDVSIRDNGTGMTEDQLRSAMRAGSSNPLDTRSKSDLGRFGLGLKTASFSQARSLSVASSTTTSDLAIRRWDLDHVGRENRWSLLKSLPPGSRENADQLAKHGPGTLVWWHNVDRIVDSRPTQDERARTSFFLVVDRVKEHLEMVFHRFLARGNLGITVNGQVCAPWDPFLSTNPATERLPAESKKLTVANGKVEKLTIQPYILPHRSALTDAEHSKAAGPRGWNLQQGFYLYRADRLIVPGDWFDLGMKPEEHSKLARICVEITQEMDHDWALDVRKSKGRPPSALRDDFRRIARATRERAQDVYRFQGRRGIGQTGAKAITAPVWLVAQEGELVSYRVNRNHPMVSQLIADATPPTKRRLTAALSLVERNVPLAHILAQGYADEAKFGWEQTKLDSEVLDEMSRIFEAKCTEGLSESDARNFVLSIQPFDQFPQLVDALERRTKS